MPRLSALGTPQRQTDQRNVTPAALDQILQVQFNPTIASRAHRIDTMHAA
jgi:hypothetical protein